MMVNSNRNSTSLTVRCSTHTKQSKSKKGKISDEEIADLKAELPNLHHFEFDAHGRSCVVTLRFPCNKKRILFVSLMEKAAAKIILRETKGIRRCALAKSKPVCAKLFFIYLFIYFLKKTIVHAHVCACVCVCMCVYYGKRKKKSKSVCVCLKSLIFHACRNWRAKTCCRSRASICACSGSTRTS